MKRLPAILALTCLAGACRRDMQDQPRYRPFRTSAFFQDGRSARPLVAGTVARGQLEEDDHLYRGRIGEEFAATFPFPVTAEVLERGRERYDIFCAPCHGRVGDGDGMIVQRGYRRPTSFHDERLRSSPVGHFFDAITRGFGVMPSYASQIPVADRWAIVAYVRALQLSQNFPAAELPPAERARLDAAAQEPAPAQEHAEEGEGHG